MHHADEHVDGADVHVDVRVLGSAIDEHDQIALPAPSVMVNAAVALVLVQKL